MQSTLLFFCWNGGYLASAGCPAEVGAAEAAAAGLRGSQAAQLGLTPIL